jgi:hypothetical protein
VYLGDYKICKGHQNSRKKDELKNKILIVINKQLSKGSIYQIRTDKSKHLE